MRIEDFTIKIFADGPDTQLMQGYRDNPIIKGFTFNPSILRGMGVKDYETACKGFIESSGGKPVSLEVIADDLDGMVEQAINIGSWGDNVYVKIPVVTSKGVFTGPAISTVAKENIKVNVTAVMTHSQIHKLMGVLSPFTPSIISIFAGRIADTGVDPCDLIPMVRSITGRLRWCQILWASTREIFSVVAAQAAGAHIITLSPALISKLHLIGRDLTQYSRETVAQFHHDAKAAGFSL